MTVSHIFSLESELEVEPSIRLHVGELLRQWDKLAEAGERLSGDEGDREFGKDGWLWLDFLPWYNYLALDVIGDLAFGSPVAKSEPNAMAAYGNAEAEGDVEYFPAVQILNERGDYSALMGVLPPWIRLLLKKFHRWYPKGSVSTVN